MKMFLQAVVLAVIIVSAVIYLFFRMEVLLAPTTQQSLNNQVCFGNNCFFVELAKSQAEIEKGLMYRQNLDLDKGMFFIFQKEGIYSFWMKNTLIALDMIWIGEDKKVVFIQKDAQPCKSLICPSFMPNKKALYVLEINGGLADKYAIKIGDLVQITPGL